MRFELNHIEPLFKSKSDAIAIAYNPFQSLNSGESFYANLIFSNLFKDYMSSRNTTKSDENSIFIHNNENQTLYLVNIYLKILNELTNEDISRIKHIENNNKNRPLSDPKYILPFTQAHYYETSLNLLKENLTKVKSDVLEKKLHSISLSLFDSKPSTISNNKFTAINKFYNDLDSSSVSDIIKDVFSDTDLYVKIHYNIKM